MRMKIFSTSEVGLRKVNEGWWDTGRWAASVSYQMKTIDEDGDHGGIGGVEITKPYFFQWQAQKAGEALQKRLRKYYERPENENLRLRDA